MAILIITYLTGLLLAFAMQRTEFEAEKKTYTKGLRLLCCVLALLSWLLIIFLLIAAWIDIISRTGYWSKPVKELPITETETTK